MRKTAISIGCVVATLLAGCVSPTPMYDERFGEAVRTARAQQTLNPNASLNTDPVTGVDGQAAKSAYGNYEKSFQTPTPPPTINVINIGGGLSGSGGGGR